MLANEPVASAGWRAELALAYERRDGRTVLAARRHEGPLMVQKPLYPEGDAVCHTLVVHPPAGIAGGDELRLDAQAGAGAHALLTTPGAGKWYRSSGAWAQQHLAFGVEADACLEWLPQETILYDRSLARMRTSVSLAASSSYIGWEILCLGRTGSGERYSRGRCHVATDVSCDGAPLWRERGELPGAALDSPAGLGGRSVCGTLLAVKPQTYSDDVLAACRAQVTREGEGGVTRLPRMIAARYLGDSSEAAREWLTRLWNVLRPATCGRVASPPRIWRT
jgi:urease accessory protein